MTNPSLPRALSTQIVYAGVQGPPGPPGDAMTRAVIDEWNTVQKLAIQTALDEVAQQQEVLAAQIEGTALPPWVVTQNEPEFVEIMALLPDAYATPTITLINTGIVFDTVEVTV